MTKAQPLIVVQVIILTILLIPACSKMTEEEAQIRQDFSSIPADMPVKNLGEVEFVSGSPKSIELNDEKSLAITATVQLDGSIQMLFEYESTERKVGGIIKESYSEQRQFLLRPGMRCAPQLGDDLVVVLRPTIIESDGDSLP